jgi:hypothetical protein
MVFIKGDKRCGANSLAVIESFDNQGSLSIDGYWAQPRQSAGQVLKLLRQIAHCWAIPIN